jgi:hypothetical protein
LEQATLLAAVHVDMASVAHDHGEAMRGDPPVFVGQALIPYDACPIDPGIRFQGKREPVSTGAVVAATSIVRPGTAIDAAAMRVLHKLADHSGGFRIGGDARRDDLIDLPWFAEAAGDAKDDVRVRRAAELEFDGGDLPLLRTEESEQVGKVLVEASGEEAVDIGRDLLNMFEARGKQVCEVVQLVVEGIGCEEGAGAFDATQAEALSDVDLLPPLATGPVRRQENVVHAGDVRIRPHRFRLLSPNLHLISANVFQPLLLLAHEHVADERLGQPVEEDEAGIAVEELPDDPHQRDVGEALPIRMVGEGSAFVRVGAVWSKFAMGKEENVTERDIEGVEGIDDLRGAGTSSVHRQGARAEVATEAVWDDHADLAGRDIDIDTDGVLMPEIRAVVEQILTVIEENAV